MGTNNQDVIEKCNDSRSVEEERVVIEFVVFLVDFDLADKLVS